jgi:TolB protein
VGVAAGGGAGDGSSVPYAITPDGRYVVFSSTSTNLLSAPVPAGQAFIRDMITGVTEIVSVSSAGVPGNSGSHPVAVSPDGRYVTFTSDASNLVAGDTNGNSDAFLRDRLLGTTERASVRADGSQISQGGSAGPVSDDGSIVLFGSTGSVTAQDAVYNDGSTYIRNRTTRTVTPLLGYRIRNGFPDPYVSDWVSMTGDARYVAFRSRPGLLSSDNTQWQAYLKDLGTGTITRLTNAADGSPENGTFNNGTISRDGRFFTYTSQATNLDPAHPNSSMSVFLLDRTSGTTENVGLGNNGLLNGSAENSSASADGRYVAFDAYATNVISPATPVGENYAYIRDRVAGTTTLVSRTWDGQVPNDHINLGPYALTADGHQLLTYSIATNVLPTPNLSSSQAVLYSTPVDIVAPTVTGSPDRPANQAGWYRAPITVTWSATDPPPSSGAPTIPAPTVVSAEGANQLGAWVSKTSTGGL